MYMVVLTTSVCLHSTIFRHFPQFHCTLYFLTVTIKMQSVRKYMYLDCYQPHPSGTSLSYPLHLEQVLLKIKFATINICFH